LQELGKINFLKYTNTARRACQEWNSQI